MGITTTADLNGLFNTIYERALFVAREQSVMAPLVRPYSAVGWMARKVTIRPQITAVSKPEGVDFVAPTDFGKTLLATLTPGMIMAQVILTDEDRDTDPDSARDDAAQELGSAMSTKIDVDLCSTFTSLTDIGPGAGQAATLAKFAVGVSRLRANHAPNPVYNVLHPYHWHDIWVELGQPASNKALLGDIANEALRSYFVGDWLNCMWFTDANIDVDGSDDAVSGIFNPQAIALDTRKAPELEPERDASALAWELNMSAGYAYGVVRETFGFGYKADASVPS